jgi:hypothetical protein
MVISRLERGEERGQDGARRGREDERKRGREEKGQGKGAVGICENIDRRSLTSS